MPTRRPAVAGMFYRSDDLVSEVEECFLGTGGPGRLPEIPACYDGTVVGLVSPHAGLVYSGAVAAHAYYALAQGGLPDVAVLIGPNHRSYLPLVAVTDDDGWLTPMGEMAIDCEVTRRIADAYPDAVVSSRTHAFEHSLEVQLPFLHYISNIASGRRIRIVPILIGSDIRTAGIRKEMEFVRKLGHAIAGSLEGKDAVVIASTDFTHYENASMARSKDSQAISRILELDEGGLLQTVEQLNISMCGVLPTAITIAACKELGAASSRELAYRNSGDVTGDTSEVVGYGALEITR